MRRAAIFVLAVLLAGGSVAQAPEKAKPAAKAKAKAQTQVRPAWAELTADQQMILAPLRADWDTLERERRRKWLGIANRYSNMKPEAQERVQRRMQAWANLTPEERRQARENYKRIAKQRAEKREKLREAWAAYQALPPHERQSLTPPPPPPEKKRR